MLRLVRWPGLALLALTVSACATMNVSSHVERGLNFTQYRTWDWAPADALPERDARLDDLFFQDHFQGAVEKQLAIRGLMQTRSDGDAPDLLLHYHANITARIDFERGARTGACYDENCSVRVRDTDLGTIVVDVVDARTNRLIWRGWAQTSIEGVLDHPARFEARIDEAARRIFARFPVAQ